jgi:FkbM family methyltransferase
MSSPFEFIATKLDTLGYRIALLNEISRLRKCGRWVPSDATKLILSAPSRFDDFVQMLGFIDNTQAVSLIDIGANRGEFSRDFNHFYPKNNFISCFEPNPSLRSVLQKNLEQVPAVTIFPFGLGSENVVLDLKVPDGADGLGSFLTYNTSSDEHYGTSNARTFSVDVKRLDDVIPDIRGPAIVKIDTQGFEKSVLEGATKTLAKCDAVLLECSFAPMHNEAEEGSFFPCSAILYDLGFVPVVFQRFGTIVNSYAFERDVLFVKKGLSNKVFHRNT